MSELTKSLRDRATKVLADARSVAETAAEANRNMDSTEEARFTEAMGEYDALSARITALTAGEEKAKELEARMAGIEGRPITGLQTQGAEDRSAELRKMLLGPPGGVFDVAQSGYQREVSYRVLTVGSGSGGGDTVPTSFYDRLVEHMIEVSAVLQAGPTVLNTTGGENIEVPKTTAHPVATIKAENSQIDTSEPTFGQETLSALKFSHMMYVSRELVADTGVDLEGYLARAAGRAVGNKVGAAFITGTGITSGLFEVATVGVTGPSVGFGDQTVVGEGFDFLIDLFHSVIAPYRASRSCAWIMSDLTAAEVRKIKNDQGMYIWQPAVTVGAPDTILGKPVFIDPFVPEERPIGFGDVSAYFARFAGPFRFERSDDFKFDTDLISYKAVQRADGALVDLTGAFKVLERAESS